MCGGEQFVMADDIVQLLVEQLHVERETLDYPAESVRSDQRTGVFCAKEAFSQAFCKIHSEKRQQEKMSECSLP